MPQIKVKIIDMVYHPEEHLFMAEILNYQKGENLKLAIKASDFGIPKNVPIEIINNFCEMMKGKEKTLSINTDGKSMKELKEENEEIPEEQLYELHQGIDQFPYYEVEKILIKEQEQKDDS